MPSLRYGLLYSLQCVQSQNEEQHDFEVIISISMNFTRDECKHVNSVSSSGLMVFGGRTTVCIHNSILNNSHCFFNIML